MDRMLAVIIIFIALMFTTAAILMTAVVPKIFQTGSQVNQTQTVLNQTQMFLESTKHEDEAREAQSQLEIQGRSQQTKLILNETRKVLDNLVSEIEFYIDRQNNTTRKLLENQEFMLMDMDKALNQNVYSINQNANITQELLNISNEHDKVSKDHDMIQGGIGNVTKDTNNDLSKYSRDSVLKLDEIIETNKQIIELLNGTNK